MKGQLFTLLIFFSVVTTGQTIENKNWVCVAKSVNGKFTLSNNCNYFSLILKSSNKSFDERGEKLIHGTYEINNRTLTLKSEYNQNYYIEWHGDMLC
jgi:hypothetical protein